MTNILSLSCLSCVASESLCLLHELVRTTAPSLLTRVQLKSKFVDENIRAAKMSTAISEIAENRVKNVKTGEAVQIKSLWQDQDAAIFFFRRWGCLFCRLWAKEISEIAPILRQNNVRVIGVGVEEIGSKEFLEGNFFDGELYYVEDLKTYNKLGFKRFNTLSILWSLLWRDSRAALAKGKSMKLGGDLRGDWVQVGGALLMQKNGTVIKHFVQEAPAEHLPNQEILQLFKIKDEYTPEQKTDRNKLECSANA